MHHVRFARHHGPARATSRQRGQALAEMGIVVTLLVFLVIGIVEVGFAFGRTNMIVHAARDGARYAATLDNSLRDPTTGCITDTSPIEDHVAAVLDGIGFEASTIGVNQDCDGTVPTITVTVEGTMQLLFNLIGTTVPVNRSVTFQDEGRVCDGGGSC